MRVGDKVSATFSLRKRGGFFDSLWKAPPTSTSALQPFVKPCYIAWYFGHDGIGWQNSFQL
jgi:hypothetical protein